MVTTVDKTYIVAMGTEEAIVSSRLRQCASKLASPPVGWKNSHTDTTMSKTTRKREVVGVLPRKTKALSSDMHGCQGVSCCTKRATDI